MDKTNESISGILNKSLEERAKANANNERRRSAEILPLEDQQAILTDFVSKGIFSTDALRAALDQQGQNPDQSSGSDLLNSTNSNSNSAAASDNSSASPNSTPHGDESIITATEIPPHLKALADPKILNEIFAQMDVPTLKSCRQLCRQWGFVGATELEKLCTITLIFMSPEQIEVFSNNGADIFKGFMVLSDEVLTKIIRSTVASSSEKQICYSDPNNPLKDLVFLMRNSLRFTCSSFVIQTGKLSAPQLSNFLSDIGIYITKLKLSQHLGVSNVNVDDGSLVGDLRNLLVDQLPNLEEFDLYIDLPVVYVFFETDNDYPQYLLDQDFLHARNVTLPVLKSFTIQAENSSRFLIQVFLEVMEAAINLESFFGPRDYSCQLIKYFLEGEQCGMEIPGSGKDRINLLKQIVFSPNKDSIEIIEKLLGQYGNGNGYNKLQLEIIRFGRFEATEEFSDTALFRKVKDLMRQLLQTSSNTLKELILHPWEYFTDFIFPQLGKLLRLNLQASDLLDSDPENPVKNNCYYFPRGFNMGKTFPKLRSICVYGSLEVITAQDFIHAHFDFPEKVPSVRRIYFENMEELTDSDRKQLRSIFPNAEVLQLLVEK